MQHAIPCALMRGGTSKGAYFLSAHLPTAPTARDRILLQALGSPDARQIDGIGGGDPLTSKVAIIGPSSDPRAALDFLFAQIVIGQPRVDTTPNCGNILSGVAAFAIDRGLIAARDPETPVIVRNVNTGALVEVVQPTPDGRLTFEGDLAIDGVPGTGAPIRLNFLDVVGSATGALLPTGRTMDCIDGISVTCIDMAVPLLLVPAQALGKTGRESPSELDADEFLRVRLELIRREAGRRMGLGDVSERVTPKLALVSPGQGASSITSRYFTPLTCHKAHAITGAIGLAAACAVPGTVAHELRPVVNAGDRVVIEHPAGSLAVELELETAAEGAVPTFRRASVLRTARKLFDGMVQVPLSSLDEATMNDRVGAAGSVVELPRSQAPATEAGRWAACA